MAAVPGILRRWNPGILPGLNVWLDASDSTTINSNADGTVNSMLDKTANSILLTQTNQENKPTVTNTYTNGKQVLKFGSNLFLSSSNFPFADTISNFTNVKVFTLNDFGPNSYLYSLTDNNGIEFMQEDYNTFLEFKTSPANTISILPDLAKSNILTQTFYNNVTSNTQLIYIPNEIITSTNKVQLSNLNVFTLGKTTLSQANSNNFSGTVSEMVFYDRYYATDSNLLNQLEGYLAWKWNLRDSLPADHPYLNRPPS